MSALWFAALIAIGAAMIVALFFAIPAAIVSILRYRLWAVRDKLFDQIHSGVYADPEQPRRLLRQIEVTIEVFDELTLLNMFMAGLLMRHAEEQPQAPPQFDPKAMSEVDRKKIMPLFWSWGGTMLRRIFFASWSGLIGFVVAAPVALVLVGFRRLRPKRDQDDSGSVMEEAKGEIRKWVSVQDRPVEVLARPNGRKTKVALSSHV
jgi:hypothetical protein